MPKIFEYFGITMSKLYIKEAKDAGNLSVDLLFSDQTTRRVDIGDFIFFYYIAKTRKGVRAGIKSFLQ